MTSPLFEPIQLRGLALENRIMVSPMCQYSAIDGCMTDWHLAHLGMLANSGAALLCFEMTDVEPIGRITPGCSGLYSDANESALERVVKLCRAHGQAKLGIDRKSTRLNSSHQIISYAVFCLKKKKKTPSLQRLLN